VSEGSALAEAARSHPEWRPWLAVVEAVAEAAGDRAWRLAVPEAPAAGDGLAPLLTGAVLTPDVRLVRRWSRHLLETAAKAGGAAAALASAARADDGALGELLESALAQDSPRVSALAVRLGVEPEALAAVAGVAAVPLLRACAERWRERLPAAWSHGYCPLCGAWPALAEARGLERTRRLRCGRCAADWSFAWLRCVYCGEDDHERLGSLVVSPPRFARTAKIVPNPIARTIVETCSSCRRYLKTSTTLAPTPADELALLDLATVELDVVVLEQGYRRPEGPGVALGACVRPRASGRLGGWRG
jgi:FdhE protein